MTTLIGQVQDAHGRVIKVSVSGPVVVLHLFGERADLNAAGADQFAELLIAAHWQARAVNDVHEHSFPCNPPGGTYLDPGPCNCGRTWDQDQAERALREAQAAMKAAGARDE